MENNPDGVFINGVKVSKAAKVKLGDQIRMGSTLLVFGSPNQGVTVSQNPAIDMKSETKPGDSAIVSVAVEPERQAEPRWVARRALGRAAILGADAFLERITLVMRPGDGGRHPSRDDSHSHSACAQPLLEIRDRVEKEGEDEDFAGTNAVS